MQATPSALLNVNRIANKSEGGYFPLCAVKKGNFVQYTNTVLQHFKEFMCKKS